MVLAYTKEQAIELLKKRPVKTSENDLKGLFELAGFQIKWERDPLQVLAKIPSLHRANGAGMGKQKMFN